MPVGHWAVIFIDLMTVMTVLNCAVFAGVGCHACIHVHWNDVVGLSRLYHPVATRSDRYCLGQRFDCPGH